MYIDGESMINVRLHENSGVQLSNILDGHREHKLSPGIHFISFAAESKADVYDASDVEESFAEIYIKAIVI